MDCHLVLTALSGTIVNVSLSVAKFDRFEDLEDHVVDYLASVTDLKVFGCTNDFLQAATQTYLENPIWKKLHLSGLQRSPPLTGMPRRVSPRQHSAGCPCPHEPRGNGPGRGVCRCTTSTSCQH